MIAKFTFNYNGGFEKKENAVFQQGSIGVDSYQVFAPFLTTTQVYIKTKRNGDLEFSLWKQLDYNSTIGGWLKTATQDELLVDGEMKVVFKFNNLVSQETSLWVRKGTLIVPEMTTYEALRDYVENQEIRIDQIINGTTDIAFDKTGTNLNSDFVEQAIKEVNTKSDANAQNIADMKDGTTIVKRAEQDKNGNDIVDTYETKSDATSKLALKADKTYVDAQDQALDDYFESEITKIKDGTTIVKKAEQDASGNVITTTYETKQDVTDKLALKEDKSAKGQPNGYAPVGADGYIPSAFIPNSFDDVLEFDTYASLLAYATPDTSKLYIVKSDETSGGNHSTYRYTGTIYVRVSDEMSASEIKALYESNANTNAFTDALKNKLDGLLNGSQYYDKNYIDALKDQNGWESELLTLTPLAPSGTIATATLLLYNTLRLQVKNTATSFVDTDSVEVSLGVVTGNKIQLSDTSVYLEIGATNSTFVAPAGWELQIVGLKYTDLVASDVSTDEVGVSVQDKLDDLDVKKANRYIDEPIAELNGHTLREVFEDGNVSLLDKTWYSDDTSSITIDGNGNIVQTSSNSFFYMYTFNHGLTNNNNYYVYAIFNANNNFNEISIDFGGTLNSDKVLNGLSNTNYFMSFKGLFGSGNGSVGWGNAFPTTSTKIVTNTKIGHINLDTLGISSLTVERIDYWFNVWQQYRYDNGLKSTVDSLQALKEKDSEIEQKVASIEESYRKSQNGELTATKFDTDNISLGKDVAPAPLQVKVDGGLLEAKQLVTNGDFSNGTTGFSLVGVNATETDGVITFLAFAGGGSIRYVFTTINNNKYYSATLLKSDSNLVGLRFKNGAVFADISIHNGDNTFKLLSGVVNTTSSNSNDYVYIGDNRTSGWTNVYVDFLYLFNISTLIANKTYSPLYNKTFNTMSDAEIKAQMDLWVQNGILPNDNVLAVGMNKRVRSVGKNLFDKSDYSLSSNADDRYLDISNLKVGMTYTISSNTPITFFKVALTQGGTPIIESPANQTAWSFTVTQTIKDVGRLYLINPSYTTYPKSVIENYNIQLELGSTATTYVPYANTDLYLQANKVGYKLPNGVADTVEYRNGKYYYVQRVKKYVLQASDIVNLVTSPTNVDYVRVSKPIDYIGYGSFNAYLGNQNLIDNKGTSLVSSLPYDQIVNIGKLGLGETQNQFIYIVSKGTYTTLTQAQTALAGTAIYYQLATPIETEIIAFGNAQGLAGGTTYIDDIMADSNLYTSKYDIENTAYPIKSLDRIVKINADGSQTELAVSSAVVAGDGLSFTHPSLVANDIVWVAYTYNVANLFKSNTFVTYYDNPFIAVQPNGTPRRITFSVDNSGVVTVSSVAV